MKAKNRDRIKSLSKEEKLALLDAIEEKKRRKREAKIAFVPHEKQIDIINSDKKIRIVTAANGCWAAGTELRMYNGSVKKVEDIVVGDRLMGPDSNPRRVLRLYKGSETLYKITPKFSDPYIVNESHVLSVFSSHISKGETFYVYNEISVVDYLNLPDNKKKRIYQWKPKEGISYTALQRPLPLDPYIFGSWIGDGTSASLSITTMDLEVLNSWREYFSDYKMTVCGRAASRAKTYKFSMGRGQPSPARITLRKMGVLNNKHIPNNYLRSSIKSRLQLLAGIIDTDGHLTKSGGYEIMQVKQMLAERIRELAQSLGFMVSMRVKKVKGRSYYRVCIHGAVERIPVRIERKKIPVDTVHRIDRWREPFSIEEVGVGDYFGVQVDSDNLVLLSDYTVQRNSGKTALAVNEVLWAALGFNPVLKTYTKVPCKVYVALDSPEKVQTVWLPEILKWYNLKEEQLKKNGKPYYTEIQFDNGSAIRFLFHLQEELAWESIEGDFFCFDEPPQRNMWVALLRAGRTKGSNPRYLLIGTPLGSPWLRIYHEDWLKGEFTDTEFFKMSTIANEKNLSKGYIESFSKHLTDRERATRLHGEFFDSAGLALAGLFDRKKHVIPANLVNEATSMPCVLSIDPHPNKPTTACLLGIDAAGVYHYLAETSQKITPRHLAQWLKSEWISKYNIVDMVCDNFGSGDYTGGEGFKSFIEVLNSENIRIRPTTYDEKKDDLFLDRIQEALYIGPDGAPKLKILGNNLGIIKDIENCAWQPIKNSETYKPKLEISNRDFLACLKYALATNLTYSENSRKIRKSYKNRSAFMGTTGRIESKWSRKINGYDNGDDW